MSEIPIEISLASGPIANGILLLLNGALAMAGTALLFTQRTRTVVQHHKITEQKNIGTLNKTQRPPQEAISSQGKVLGLIDLRKT